MRLQDAFAEYAGSQAHDGFQAFVHAAERRDAVKRQSGAPPVAARFGNIQDSGGINKTFFFHRVVGGGAVQLPVLDGVGVRLERLALLLTVEVDEHVFTFEVTGP